LTAALILLVLALALAALLYLGYRSAEQLGKILAQLSQLVNWVAHLVIHRDFLAEENAYLFAREAAEGIAMIRGRRKDLLWPFLFALNNKALLICVMTFTFLALGVPFSVGTVVGGVSIASLFLIISPTPSGVGIVEGILPFALDTLRVPFAAAVLVTLIYRAVTFWFPLLVGGVAFRILGSNRKATRSARAAKREQGRESLLITSPADGKSKATGL
jgi:uncharacterized protein (TIRG00374 family)